MQNNQSWKKKSLRNRPHKKCGKRDADTNGIIHGTNDSCDLIGVAHCPPAHKYHLDCDYKHAIDSLHEMINNAENNIRVLTANNKRTDGTVQETEEFERLLKEFRENVTIGKKTIKKAQRYECPKHSGKTSKSEHASNCKLNVSCMSIDELNEVHGTCHFKMISPSPPIIVYSDWETVRDLLSKADVRNYTGKVWADYIRFRANCHETYNQMLNVFDRNKIKYYTYTPRDQKRYRVVIRGVPASIPVDLIKQYLVQQKYPVLDVSRMHINKNKHPIDLILVSLTKKDIRIRSMGSLFGHNIIIERPHIAAGHPQCHRCQQYGHSQRHCRMPPRCVKCAGDHMTRRCTKTKEEPPKCSNCYGEHTANFKDCPKAPLPLIFDV